MSEWKKNKKEEREIDLWRFVEVFLKRAWAIALAVIIFGMCGFAYTKLLVTPMYKSQFLAYITNKTEGSSDTSGSYCRTDLTGECIKTVHRSVTSKSCLPFTVIQTVRN